jgi:YihY family inner membrane protein
MTDLTDKVDRFQRQHPLIGFPLAVVYKFFDDQGSYLASIITYYTFIAIFPLMLIASSILGFLLQGNPKLQQEILNSALSQFPIVGGQLGRPEGLRGSASAVVVGALAALYGVLGLGQAGQNAMNAIWAVPRNSRPNPFLARLRSLVLLALAGLALLLVALLTSLGSHVGAFGPEIGAGLRWSLNLGAVVLNAVVLTFLFRLATARKFSFWSAAPGALAVALMWQGLQFLGAIYVSHVIARANAMNGVFALVLGLMALIYIAVVMAILGVEINVVHTKKLFPRALLTPFTDNVELTPADRRVYVEYAQAQRHKGFEQVSVTFHPRQLHEKDE